MCLAISTPAVLPSVGRKTSAPRTCLTPLNTSPAPSPVNASRLPSRASRASLGAGAVRYSFTVTDFHRPPFAGLPAHPSTPSAKGRFDPFAKPTINDRYLRTADGRSRRKPVIEDRDGGGCGWGKAVVRVERYRMGRLAMLSHRLRRPRPSARVPDDIDGEDRCEAAGRGHCSGTPALRMPA
jgi:hypothetical protein